MFRADGHSVQHLAHTKEPQERSSITCLAFSASGLYFSLGYADGNVHIMDTCHANASVDVDKISVHECVFITPRDKSLTSITAIAFGAQEQNERIIVGDRSGNVREFNYDIMLSSALPFSLLHLSHTLCMWLCPSPSEAPPDAILRENSSILCFCQMLSKCNGHAPPALPRVCVVCRCSTCIKPCTRLAAGSLIITTTAS